MGIYKEKIFNTLLITAGTCLLILSLYYSGVGIDYRMFAVLFTFAIILDNLGIMYTDIKLSISPTIAIAAFLIFGINAAALLMIASTMFDTIVVRKKLKNGLINGAMFSITYITAGWLFEFVGGKIGVISLQQMIYILIYVSSSFLINNFILYYALKVQGKILFKEYWNESVALELLSYLVMLPLAIIFADLYLKYGFAMFLILLLPTILIAYIFKLMRNLIKVNKRLNAVYEMVKLINSKLDIDKTFDAIIDAVSQAVSISSGAIYLVDDNGIAVLTKAVLGKDADNVFKESYFKDEGIIGKSLSTAKTIVVKNLKKNKEFSNEIFSKTYCSAMVVPIKCSGAVIGCIAVFQIEAGVFDDDSLKIMETIADQASVAIANAKMYYEVSKKSITDPLTKTYNRRYFNDALNENILKSDENKSPVSLIMFDIDKFKLINDTYGHLIGDEVLKEIAARIKNTVRGDDIVSRFGGEEFTVILPRLTAEQAYMIAERIRNEVSSKPIKTSKGDLYITISGGVADYPEKAESAEKLVSHADRALYAGSKSKGRNRIAIYEV